MSYAASHHTSFCFGCSLDLGRVLDLPLRIDRPVPVLGTWGNEHGSLDDSEHTYMLRFAAALPTDIFSEAAAPPAAPIWSHFVNVERPTLLSLPMSDDEVLYLRLAVSKWKVTPTTPSTTTTPVATTTPMIAPCVAAHARHRPPWPLPTAASSSTLLPSSSRHAAACRERSPSPPRFSSAQTRLFPSALTSAASLSIFLSRRAPRTAPCP